jgi:hypothetical protein
MRQGDVVAEPILGQKQPAGQTLVNGIAPIGECCCCDLIMKTCAYRRRSFLSVGLSSMTCSRW